MKECGVVTKIENGIATIELKKNEGCHSCGLCLCGQDPTLMVLTAAARAETNVGDRVQIEVDRRIRSLAQLWLLAVPIAVFLATALVAKLLLKLGDGISFLISIAALAGSFWLAWYMDKKTGWSSQPVARIAEHSDGDGDGDG